MISSKNCHRYDLTVIGGGLAGCEASYQAAKRGLIVRMIEMRPVVMTPAHTGENLAELICSNSLGSMLSDRPSGLLMNELRLMGSLLLECAEKAALPAGGALAVDRVRFSEMVTQKIIEHPNITLIREEVIDIPNGLTVLATGPLTSPSLARAIANLAGEDNLFFFDAIAPTITADSIDMQVVFRSSRYGRSVSETGDYLNCPLDDCEYRRFVRALIGAERNPLRHFEDEINQGVIAGDGRYFEGCLPIEVLAARGEETLAFGPMRPVGLCDPHTGKRPHAILQLRQDDFSANLYNLVGFQTNLTFGEQERVFRLIPGLEKAEFIRYGQMHRNTFIASPRLLDENLFFSRKAGLLFAGQITGVEGYLGSIATGALAGINTSCIARNYKVVSPPRTTMLGALCYYISHTSMETFQPMKANFGLLPDLEQIKHREGKREKHRHMTERALTHLGSWLGEVEGQFR